MPLLLELFGITLTGLGLHQLYRPTTTLGPRWGSLTRYAIGIIGLLPCLLVVNRKISHPHYGQAVTAEGETERLTVAYLISAVCLAIGVVLGHFLDRVLGRDE